MKLIGANPAAKVVGLEELPGKSNYFLGKDPKKWRTNVPTYARVKYANVYPGVDVVYYGNQWQLEYDFVVSPGADPQAITLEIQTANAQLENRNPKIDANGDLVIATDAGEVRFRKPIVYQPALDSGPGTGRLAVEGKFVLLASNRVGFEVPNYDKTKLLVIDPVLAYSSYLGGSGGEGLGSCVGIAVDSDGNAYVVSGTTSLDFPTTGNAFQQAYGGGPGPNGRYYECGDAFLNKVDPTGSTLVYSTYLGGSGCESAGIGVAVDSHGSAYVTGSTDSTNFPTTSGAFQTAFGGSACDGWNDCGDAFVTKFSPDGSALVYSTYLGGAGNDLVDDTIEVDLAGNAYVAGNTDSTNFPTTA
ncbi:MAG: SBBP repeat-containing protein, partial [Acidobacteriia bacterium]|nr:SBBP repeat-containing protein [Terriglobia bacterium]